MIQKHLSPRRLSISLLFTLLLFSLAVVFEKFSPFVFDLYSLVYIVFIPGLLTLAVLKVKGLGAGEKIVASVGLSLSFLMLGGLFLNLLYLAFRWPSPFNKFTLLTLVDAYVGLTILTMYRQRHSFTLRIEKVQLKSIGVALLPLCFVLQAWLGASLLNNGGSNTIAFFLLAEIAVLFTYLAYKNNDTQSWVTPWSIFWVSYALLLMSSLRSNHVIGSDISEEYKAVQVVLSQGYWQPVDYKSIYNACLSITVLPAEIMRLTHIGTETIFKAIMPLAASAIPLTLYVTFKRYSKSAAVLGSLFFISFPAFFITLSQHSRQAVALFFFALCVMLFSINLGSKYKKLLFMLFAISMVVAHYSVAYLAIAIFALSYFLSKALDRWDRSRANKHNLGFKEMPLTSLGLLVIFLFSFMWYSQVTLSSGTLNDFLSKSLSNIGNTLSSDNKADRSSLFDQFNVTYSSDPQQNLNELVSSTPPSHNTLVGKNQNYSVNYIPSAGADSRIGGLAYKTLYYFGEIVKKILQIFIPVGILFLYTRMRQKPYAQQYTLLAAACVVATVAVLVIPFASLYYSFERAYIQTNIVLAPLAVIGVLYTLKLFKQKHAYSLTISAFIIYFVFYSGLSSALLGSNSPYTSLYNKGQNYNSQYVFDSEVDAAKWVSRSWEPQDQILADDGDSSKVLAYSQNITQIKTKLIVPSQISDTNYVYSGVSNTRLDIGYVSVKGGIVGYEFPTDFLAQNKNTVYSNGDVRIYK